VGIFNEHTWGFSMSAITVAESAWADAIPADRPTMVVADGLFAFLNEPVIVAVLRRITGHFGPVSSRSTITALSAGQIASRARL
jgi:O-methyltransferase involved in polyketide biosynthesis